MEKAASPSTSPPPPSSRLYRIFECVFDVDLALRSTAFFFLPSSLSSSLLPWSETFTFVIRPNIACTSLCHIACLFDVVVVGFFFKPKDCAL